MQFTDLLIIHFFSFFLLLFSLLWNLLVSLTMKTRQINAPKWPAKISCYGNLLVSPARITRRIYSPEKSAISTRGLLAWDPPFPAQNPQARPGPPSLPPPPNSSANGAGGRGQGAGPAHPRILNWYFYNHSHLTNGYIFLYDTIHTYSTQSGLIWKYKCITVGEGIIARKGWGASLLPAPLKGMFCIIWGQQACHTDEDRIWKHI